MDEDVSVDVGLTSGSLNATGDPVGFATTANRHIVFRDASAHVYDAFFHTQWHLRDLTATVPGALSAVDDPIGYVGANLPRIVYRTADNQIHEFHDPGIGWLHFDL